MLNPFKCVQFQTLVDVEIREDEDGNKYEEEVILAQDKRIKCIIDFDDIVEINEVTNDKGVIYKKRVLISTGGGSKIINKSYDEMEKLLFESKEGIGFVKERN